MTNFFSWQNKDLRILCFTCFNALVSFVWTMLLAPEYTQYSPFLVPFLNMITKYINNKFFNDVGVLPTNPTV